MIRLALLGFAIWFVWRNGGAFLGGLERAALEPVIWALP